VLQRRNRTSVNLDVSKILGPGGLINRRLPNYEHRQQQLQMAEAVVEALRTKRHLIAEAGTGVGKSFAYLVPAILHATSDQNESPKEKKGPSRPGNGNDDEDDKNVRRVVISTHTISLQEQLINKDLPLLNSVIPREFTSVLVKGRSNYLSRRRFELAKTRSVQMLDDNDAMQLQKLSQWVKTTADGSLSSMPFRPGAGLWDEVASDNTNCMGKKCKTHESCFYYAARRRVFGAQVLVANHALFFTDLALKAEVGFGILPEYSAAILDECHTIESVASGYLGIKVTAGQLRYTLNKLYNPATNRGLFVALGLDRMCEQVNRALYSVEQFVFDLDQWMGPERMDAKRVAAAGIVSNTLSDQFLAISKYLSNAADNANDASKHSELSGAANRLESIANDIISWLSQRDESMVYWLERAQTRAGLRVDMHAAPVDISGKMREMLFQNVPSVIMTSATVSTGREGGFQFFQSRIGATGSMTIQMGSPFDYKKQAELIIVTDMPDPSANAAEFQKALPDMIKRYLLKTGGRAFVLFTSYGLLRHTASAMQSWFAEQNLTLYSQAEGTPRGKLLDMFKDNPKGALFGTDSFWQGVDVPGDALGNVIITKLPFSVPDHPLLAARLDAIRKAGGNPFRDYQIPEAVIKLRQGFGRLIRTAQDQGIVVVLDPRIRSKYYGRQFLAALPDCKVSYHSRR
jgi:ATP-dependent DNA helicase DinG